MCKYLSSWGAKGKPCDLSQQLQEELPLDDFGLCVFHSGQFSFKEMEGFSGFLEKLINHINSGEVEKPYKMYGIQFIASHDPQDFYDASDLTEIRVPERIIQLTDLELHRALSLFECKFLDEVEISNSKFHGVLNFSKCEFVKQVFIKGGEFREDFEFENSCVFKNKLILNGARFDGAFHLNQATIRGDLELNDCTFESPCWIIECTFGELTDAIQISSKFKDGFAFERNKSACLLNVYQSEFHASSTFKNIQWATNMDLQDCEYYGSIQFQGVPSKLMFNPDTIISIDTVQIHGSVRFTFDYCEIRNLNDEFFDNLKELEAEERIVIMDTCELYRFKHVFRNPMRELNAHIFYDFHTLVTRYFEHLFSLELEVKFRRIKERKMFEVSYASRDNLQDSFLIKLQEVVDKLEIDTFLHQSDLEFQRRNLWRRFNQKRQIGELSSTDLLDLLGFNGTVNIEKVNTLQFINAHRPSLSIQNAEQLSLQQGNVHIHNLDKLENNPEFNLNESQFSQLKEELTKRMMDPVVMTKLKAMLESDVDKAKKEESLSQFAMDSGIVVGRAVMGGTILMVLRAVFSI